MSDIQRYGDPSRDYMIPAHDDGFVVLYADHVAAVAAAEQRAGEQAHGHYMDGYNKAWSLSAAEIERQVREEEQVAQTLARAELYSMEEMDERCTQAADEAFAAGVKAARDAVAAHIRADLTGQEMFCGRKRGILAAIDALISGKIGESDE